MKTKTLQMASGLLMVIFWLATFTLNAQITFEGNYADHEGGIGWDADGTGTEPAGDGHNNQYYYGASPDYDGIDPDPNAALGHFLEITDGFTEFLKVLEENDVDLNDIKMRYTLSSLGNDEEGIDWVTIGTEEYINYYGSVLKIFVQNELMISMQIPYLNFKYLSGSGWYVETPFMIPKDASMWSDSVAKKLAAAFMNDMDGHSLQMTCYPVYSGHDITTDGRDGAWYNVFNGLLKKGCPAIPFKGLNADHEGFAGWDADGSGPEPAGDGHLDFAYYVASLDYNEIDVNPEASLGHFLEGSKGFRNLMMQLEYRGYDINDLKMKMGLASLANDEQGIDWGSNWLNYYNQSLTILFNNEPILQFMSDTALIFVYSSYFGSESTFSSVKNISQNASEDAQIIAQAFLFDIGTHQISIPTTDMRAGSSFNENGRNGAYFQVLGAKLIGMCGMVNCIEEGNLAGTLKAENSPYLINGNIEVPAGQTLNIEPGTKIAFRGPYHINVKGGVNAEGTAEEPIIFTHSNPLVLWDGFDYDSTAISNDTSYFNHCLFEYGYGFGEGPYVSGGIFALAIFDNLIVENSIFRNNRVNKAGDYPASGGAVALWNSSPMFVNCIFHNNSAKLGGAIIAYLDSDPIISNCLFYNNIAEQDGGAIEFFTNSDVILINNTFADNFAGRYGGAVDIYDNSNPTFINTIMWGNRAEVAGNQVNLYPGCSPGFHYSDIQGGTEEFGGPTFTGEYVECIDSDPNFLGMWDHPYQLFDESPCIDKGNADTLEFLLPEFDLAGLIRLDGEAIDIGAYEWNETVHSSEIPASNNALIIYPNPFSHSTNISFELEKTTWVQVDVYNVIGEIVDVILQSELLAGKHTLIWQADKFSNGIYFIKLQAGNTITTNKLLKN